MTNKFKKVSGVSKFKLYSFKVTVTYRNTGHKIIIKKLIVLAMVHFQVLQSIISQ